MGFILTSGDYVAYLERTARRIAENGDYISGLDAATGAVKWTTPTGHAVSEGADEFQYFGAPNLPTPVRLVDYDGNGSLDIVTVATNYSLNQSIIAVYDGQGEFLRHWTTSEAVRAMEVADFDGDGKYESAVGMGVGSGGKPGVSTTTTAPSAPAGRSRRPTACIPTRCAPWTWTATGGRSWSSYLTRTASRPIPWTGSG